MLSLALAVLKPKVADVYVSPLGNDAWSGRMASPNRTRTDGPLASLQAAVSEARQLKSQKPDWIQIELAEGRYRLTSKLKFTNSDNELRIEGPLRGAAVLDGGRRITGWTVDPNGWWHTKLPEVADGRWYFSQLWVDGERRFRTRFPGTGYDTIADAAPASPAVGAKGFDRFQFQPGALNPNWHALSDVEVLGIHTWSMARMRIASIDNASHLVTLTGTTPGTASWAAFPKGGRYLVENVREALGREGDWYLDRASGELTYIPKPGERPGNCDVEAPVADSLVQNEGAENLTFRRVGFEHTNWNTPPGGHDFPQAEADLPAAITFAKGSGTLDHCSVGHLGSYAIEAVAGCGPVLVVNSTLWDLGGGGVKVGPMGYLPSLAPMNVEIKNCRIVGGGRLHPAAVGVWIGQAAGVKVISNEVRDFYYTGVSVGWSWGYAADGAHDNLIACNEISDLGQHVLSDMGGIYTLGVQPGTQLIGNRIHDVTCFAYGGWGIYPDEGSSNELISSNVVYGCQSAGFHQHYGQNNLVFGNIFAMNGEAEIVRTRAEDHLSFEFKDNIIAWATGALFGGNWSGTGYKFDGNLYWHYGGPTPTPTQEPGAIIADPLFVDPIKHDFRLRPGSPATYLMAAYPRPPYHLGPDSNGPAPVAKVPRAFPDPFEK